MNAMVPADPIAMPARARALIEQVRAQRGPFFVSRVLMRVNVMQDEQLVVDEILAAAAKLGLKLER